MHRIKRINLGKVPRVQLKDLKRLDISDLQHHTKRNTCPICFNEIQEESLVTELPNCQHLYHHDCLEKWFIVDSKCPICKQDYLETYL